MSLTPATPAEPTAVPGRRLIAAVALISAGLLAFEIGLMRVLLVASWHHFSFLVISIGLLGFGASGSLLLALRTWLLRRAAAALFGLGLATALSIPLCTNLAQRAPIEARIAPALLGPQLAAWVLFWALLSVPFLLGASAIGLALMMGRQRVSLIYAANLTGSGAGAMLATAMMALQPPAWLSVTAGATTLLGAVCVPAPSAYRRTAIIVISLAGAALWLWVDPPHIRTDPYKFASHVQRLQRQGAVSRAAVRYSPSGQVEAYRGNVFHELAFLSGDTTPPPMHALLIDGHWAGSVLDIQAVEQAQVVEQTLMAFAYELAPARPKVLLLGERGGANIWLAAGKGAATIDIVQPHAALFKVLRGPLHREGGQVLGLSGVRAIAAEPRHFVTHAPARYDLIQLVSLEGSAAGSAGIGGLGQDYLATIEGITACLDHLTPDGVLAVGRGIQTPPRDNLKLMALFAESLRRRGINEPEHHIVIVRDYLAVCTLGKPTAWTKDQINRVRRLCQINQLTPVWFPGVGLEELNQPDALPGPAGSEADWYHHAATRLLGPNPQRFIDQWLFDIRPPSDNRPFFLDFFKLRSVAALQQTFGDLWLSRAEMAFLFVLAAIVATTGFAVVLTLGPLLFLARRHPSAHWFATAGFFGSIGLGYLVLEITLLSRLTHLIGDPVQAAAVTIATFLVISGLGSAAAGRLLHWGPQVLTAAVGVLIVTAVLLTISLGPLASWAGHFPMPLRWVLAVAALAPLAFAMGFPMPMGLSRLSRHGPDLLPWAWGINGFASVIAAPLAMAIAMTWGFWQAGAVALVCYVVAALLFRRLPKPSPGADHH